MTDAASKPRAHRWAVAGLLLILAFEVAWRWHTIGPSPISRPFEGWLVRSGETEPLDCDEAAYAYMGRRILHGDVLYRDLVENKPPLGYWLYALAVAIGGANEWTVRLMAIPYVLATTALVWSIGRRLGGSRTAGLGAFLFAVASADPYLFGNGSNLEHFLNLFSVASLALVMRAVAGPSRAAAFAAGAVLALETLVKQVAATHGLVFVAFLLIPSASRNLRDRLGDALALFLGFLAPWAVALAIVCAQGAGPAAYECMVTFAKAVATDIPPAPHSPPWLVRLVTGNADPEGKLPWPFGSTTYYVWWAAGLWPFWVASAPATVRLVFPSHVEGEPHSTRFRRLLAAWTASCWLQILLPGQFWPHYYLLAVPGASIAVAVWLIEALRMVRHRPWPGAVVATTLVVALVGTVLIQARDYLGRTPDEITSDFKGGKQWVTLRKLGREIALRSKVWDDPRLHVWGWQSPLYVYSGLDGVTRHFFANELLKAHADGDHPLVRRWLAEMMRDLRARPPELIFAGHPPFPALREFLLERYLPSPPGAANPGGRGLWVERGRYGEYEAGRSALVKP